MVQLRLRLPAVPRRACSGVADVLFITAGAARLARRTLRRFATEAEEEAGPPVAWLAAAAERRP